MAIKRNTAYFGSACDTPEIVETLEDAQIVLNTAQFLKATIPVPLMERISSLFNEDSPHGYRKSVQQYGSGFRIVLVADGHETPED